MFSIDSLEFPCFGYDFYGIFQDFSEPVIVSTFLDVFGLVLIFRFDPVFLWIWVDFHALLMISMNSWFLWIYLDFYALVMIFMNFPECLCMDYDSYGIFWILMDRSSFLQFCLDVPGLVAIFRVDPDFYKLVWISMHCLWFQWILPNFYVLENYFINSSWFLCIGYDFLEVGYDNYNLVLISMVWSWLLGFAKISKVRSWFLWFGHDF